MTFYWFHDVCNKRKNLGASLKGNKLKVIASPSIYAPHYNKSKAR
jgi:hypothetical protein